MKTTPIQIPTRTGDSLPGLRIGPVDVCLGSRHGKYPDGNYVVVRGSDSCASFDMPLVCHGLQPQALGQDLVILSHVHEDHTAGLGLLRDTPVHVHEHDVQAIRGMQGLAEHYGYSPAVTAAMCLRTVEQFHYAPRPDALAYVDGATWDLGGTRVRAIHAPGHTSGHCVLMVEPHGVAFLGDIDLTGFGPYYGDATSDLASLRRSLAMVRQMVRRLEAACWVTSHHRGVVSDRATLDTLLDRYTSVLDRRDEALLACLRDGPMTLAELAARRFVYPATFDDIFVDDVERRFIVQHLHALRDQGLVELHDEHWHAN